LAGAWLWALWPAAHGMSRLRPRLAHRSVRGVAQALVHDASVTEMVVLTIHTMKMMMR
jgi:hypothetical protein